jgi:hypothetical protein
LFLSFQVAHPSCSWKGGAFLQRAFDYTVLRLRFALDAFAPAHHFGKAVAEPPHSKMGWAVFQPWTLRDTAVGRGGARFALRVGAKWLRDA